MAGETNVGLERGDDGGKHERGRDADMDDDTHCVYEIAQPTDTVFEVSRLIGDLL
jgi:hypothetical protein